MGFAAPEQILRQDNRVNQMQYLVDNAFPAFPLQFSIDIIGKLNVSFQDNPLFERSGRGGRQLPRPIIRIRPQEVQSAEMLEDISVEKLEILVLEVVCHTSI